MTKHIYMPQVTNLAELFDGFEFTDKAHTGSSFISSPLSQHIGTHTYDAKRDVATIHKARFCSLYGKGIKQIVRDTIEPHMIGAIGTFRILKRNDGSWLVIACCETIGERWVCELPTDYDLRQHLSVDEKALIDASKADFNAAIADAPETSTYKKRGA